MKDQITILKTAILADKKGFPFKGNCIYSVTQTYVQRWLREEHKIIVLVDTFLGSFICKVNNVIVSNNKTGNILKYTTYEEALEQGLLEGLNRI